MSRLPLTFACGLYDRLVPLYTQAIQVSGIDLNFIVLNSPRAIFDRMGGGQEFDASEFSSSEFIARHARGDLRRSSRCRSFRRARSGTA